MCLPFLELLELLIVSSSAHTRSAGTEMYVGIVTCYDLCIYIEVMYNEAAVQSFDRQKNASCSLRTQSICKIQIQSYLYVYPLAAMQL